jgi:hypothetical protein
VGVQGESDLPQLVSAGQSPGGFPGRLHRRHREPHERSHDRDHREELDQCETLSGPTLQGWSRHAVSNTRSERSDEQGV